MCDVYDLVPPEVIGGRVLLPGCGIRLERITGKARKLAHLNQEQQSRVTAVLWQIIDAIEPGNVWDSSCFFPGSRAEFTVVDFALSDEVDHFSEPLERVGQLSEEQRAKLRAFGAI